MTIIGLGSSYTIFATIDTVVCWLYVSMIIKFVSFFFLLFFSESFDTVLMDIFAFLKDQARKGQLYSHLAKCSFISGRLYSFSLSPLKYIFFLLNLLLMVLNDLTPTINLSLSPILILTVFLASMEWDDSIEKFLYIKFDFRMFYMMRHQWILF